MATFDSTPETDRLTIAASLERFAEDEALTDRLDDEGARMLFAWGAASMQAWLASSRSQGEVNAYARQIMDGMRAINHLNRSRKDLSDVAFVEKILEIIRLAPREAKERSDDGLDEE